MTNPVKAHLNGGPRDDEYVVVDGYEMQVARAERLTLADPPTMAAPFRTGYYRSRLDGNSELVPHDLTGTVEFDWAGWDPLPEVVSEERSADGGH